MKTIPSQKSHAVFANLFSWYRSQSNYKSLEKMSDALAELNISLDSSTLSHWQCGTRIPKDRRVLIFVIKILIDGDGLKTEAEANSLLEAADQGYLTRQERKYLFSKR